MTINTGSGKQNAGLSLQSGGNGNIIWYDTSQGFQGSGVLLKQTTRSRFQITGPYAMGLIGGRPGWQPIRSGRGIHGQRNRRLGQRTVGCKR